MSGTRLSNVEIVKLIRSKEIRIDHFLQQNLGLAHYRMRPGNLWEPVRKRGNGSYEFSHVHDLRDGPYMFGPNEYLIVTPIEHIVLPVGICGEVVGASTLVEQGFSLVSGKLDPGYGALGGKRQDFLVGLKNMLDAENSFYPQDGVAHISFTDFRQSDLVPTSWSPARLRVFDDRHMSRRARAEDDGPFYETEDAQEDTA